MKIGKRNRETPRERWRCPKCREWKASYLYASHVRQCEGK